MAAHSRTLDKVSTGVAVFGGDRKLVYGNDAFARIWSVDSAWLDEKPSASEFLDQLRQRRLLPEQPDYRKWRDGKCSHGIATVPSTSFGTGPTEEPSMS